MYKCCFMNNRYKFFELIDHDDKLQQNKLLCNKLFWHSFTFVYSMKGNNNTPEYLRIYLLAEAMNCKNFIDKTMNLSAKIDIPGNNAGILVNKGIRDISTW